jgi:uncharacterized protein
MAGRENSPIFERTQQAKEEAFQVYLQSLKVDEDYKNQLKQMEEAEKARKKQLVTSIAMAVASSALSVGGKAFGAGFQNAAGAAKALNPDIGFGGQMWAGLKGGIGFGGTTGEGGLGNLFSGNFSSAFTDFSKMGPTKPQYQFDDNKQYRGVTVGGATYLPRDRFSGGVLNIGGPSRPTNYPTNNIFGGNLFPRKNQTISSVPISAAQLRAADQAQADLYGSPYMRPYKNAANGGPILGGSGVRDDVPAMLTGGEFVLNNRATQKLGMSNLQRLNSGDTSSQQSSSESSSDLTQALMSKLDELINATQKTSKDNVVVNVSGMDSKGEKNDGTYSTNEKELQKKIKSAVLEVINQEKRLGGSLNK